MELLAGIGRDLGMATILVTHDLSVVAQACDRVVRHVRRRVIEEQAAVPLYAAPRHPYTRALLASFPDVAHPDRPLRGIPGTPPRLDAMPPGCRLRRDARWRSVRVMRGGRRSCRWRAAVVRRASASKRRAHERSGASRSRPLHDVCRTRSVLDALRRRPPRPIRAVDGRASTLRRRGTRARGRVGLRQDHDRAPAAGPHAAHRGLDPGRRRRGGHDVRRRSAGSGHQCS